MNMEDQRPQLDLDGTSASIVVDVCAEPPPPPPLPVGCNDAPSPDLISPRNRGVMLRWLEGQRPADIAATLQLTPKKVKAILCLRAVKQEIQRLSQLTNEEYIKDRVARMAEEALDTLRDAMRGSVTSELRFKAAKELLDKVPVLRAPSGEFGRSIGEGLGEAIINRLAQLEATQAQTIDVTEEAETQEAQND